MASNEGIPPRGRYGFLELRFIKALLSRFGKPKVDTPPTQIQIQIQIETSTDVHTDEPPTTPALIRPGNQGVTDGLGNRVIETGRQKDFVDRLGQPSQMDQSPADLAREKMLRGPQHRTEGTRRGNRDGTGVLRKSPPKPAPPKPQQRPGNVLRKKRHPPQPEPPEQSLRQSPKQKLHL